MPLYIAPLLAKKEAKRVHLVAKEHAENVTLVAYGNAMGVSIPPLILFKEPEWTDNFPPGSIAQRTAKGSMAIEAFKIWLRHFASYNLPGPCLLIFDGAKSRSDYTIVTVADELGITLYCLSSNTTHELQPLDKAVFRWFEHFWDDEVLKFWANHSDRSVTKQCIGSIF